MEDRNSRQFLGLTLAIVLLCLLGLRQIRNYLSRRRFSRERGCKPAQSIYKAKDPIFGIDHIIEAVRHGRQRDLLEFSHKRYQKYGTTFQRKLPNEHTTWTIEPQNIQAVLATNFKDWGLRFRQRAFLPLLGYGIFTTDGEAWSHSRSLIRPNFVRDQVADLDAFEEHITDLFEVIPRDGRTVDLQDLFFRFTIDSATQFLFGRSVRSLRPGASSDGLDAKFADAFNLAQLDCAERIRLGGFLKFRRTSPEVQDAISICHAYVDQFVDIALQHREKTMDVANQTKQKYVFLEELAKATPDRKRLRDELLNVLLAGRDTTASLLSNVFIQVAKQPHIWDKLQEEVAGLGGARPTYEQLRNLKYVKYCLNESLRLHPVVPINGRKAIRDTYLPLGGGPDGKSPLFIPKGGRLHYQVYSMHRRPEFFGNDAELFRPERWAEDLRPGWAYLPFNGGPRICLGQQYALTEASYVTVRLLQEFSKIESRDSKPWTESLSLTTCSHHGTLVSLTPR